MNEKKGETMSKEQIIKDFMKKPINKEAKNNQTNETETTNIVTLPNGLKLKINPTKLKYFKSGDFATCSLIKTLGVSVLITKYADGYEVLCRYLSAIFDKPYTKIQRKNEETEQYSTECVFDEYITNLLDNELSMIDIENIIDTAFKVNHIKAEDFFLPELSKMA